MDRRKSLKLLATGAVASPLLLDSCKNPTETKVDRTATDLT